MNNRQTLVQYLSELLDIPADEITMEKRLVEDLHADSLDLVELTMWIEKKLGIHIAEADIVGMQTVGDVTGYIERYV